MDLPGSHFLEELARHHGFDAVGVAPVVLPEEKPRLEAWLAAGYAGSMQWLERDPDVRIDLRERFPWARSVVVVMRRYGSPLDDGAAGLLPFMASYARGLDYHDILLPRLKSLATDLAESRGRPDARSHAYVDTGPALERRLAAAAGLGWTGHNALLLNRRSGSRNFLGVLVSEFDLGDPVGPQGSCGSCSACQSACPTGAFVQPGVLDARRCISYLTIEFRGTIPRELRPAMGQWLFGCDLCQTCCPFEMNSRVDRVGVEPAFLSTGGSYDIDLAELLTLDEEAFRARFRKTPLWRPRRVGLLRNAVIVVANGEHREALPAVVALLDDSDPVLREVAGWCLARMEGAGVEGVLSDALERETDPQAIEGLREDLESVRG